MIHILNLKAHKRKWVPEGTQFRLSGSLFMYRPVSACGLTRVKGERIRPLFVRPRWRSNRPDGIRILGESGPI